MAISTKLGELLARDPSIVLGPADLRELDAKFRKIDIDGDGEITRAELHRSLDTGHSAPFVVESKVDAFLQDMDLDGDGMLTFEELTSATAVRRVEKLLAAIAREVTILDPGGDANETAVAAQILDRLLDAIGLYDAAARASLLATVERRADGRVDPETLALAFFAAKRK
jgi:calcium-binding protein CML